MSSPSKHVLNSTDHPSFKKLIAGQERETFSLVAGGYDNYAIATYCMDINMLIITE